MRLFDGSVGWTQMAGSSAASPALATGSVSADAVTSSIAGPEVGATWPGAGAEAKTRDRRMTRNDDVFFTRTLLEKRSTAIFARMPVARQGIASALYRLCQDRMARFTISFHYTQF